MFFELENRSNGNRRIQFIPRPSNPNMFTLNDAEAGAVSIDPATGTLSVCLAPAEIIEVPWDIEYGIGEETIREFSGNPIPSSFADNAAGARAGQFENASSLKINNTVSQIGTDAFRYWLNATSLLLPNSLLHIGHQAFRFWSCLEQRLIPDSVLSIGTYSFANCTNAQSIDIGTNVGAIYGNAFEGCTSLTQITVNSLTPPTLYSGALNDTNHCPIYVPSDVVATYKQSDGWNDFSDRIFAIP